MADEKKTTFADVEQKFHSMPLTKYEIPEALEAEWLSTAVADFELNLGCDLGYNEETREFSGKLKSIAVRTLAQMMYVSYLQRELSRVMALNGIYGKDVQLNIVPIVLAIKQIWWRRGWQIVLRRSTMVCDITIVR